MTDDANVPSSTVLRIVRKGRGFVQIDNAAVRDERLSFRARGVLAYLLSHRSGYRCTSRDMAAQGQEGRTAILTAMKELRDVGYVSHEKVQDDHGRWVTITTVREDPSLTPPGSDCRTSVPGSDEPDPGLPDPLRSTSPEDQLSRDRASPEDDESAGVTRDEEVSAGEVLRAAFEVIISQRMEGVNPDNVFAYRNTVRGAVRQEHAEQAKQLLSEHPDWDAATLAASLEPKVAPSAPVLSEEDRLVMERTRAHQRKAREQAAEDARYADEEEEHRPSIEEIHENRARVLAEEAAAQST